MSTVGILLNMAITNNPDILISLKLLSNGNNQANLVVDRFQKCVNLVFIALYKIFSMRASLIITDRAKTGILLVMWAFPPMTYILAGAICYVTIPFTSTIPYCSISALPREINLLLVFGVITSIPLVHIFYEVFFPCKMYKHSTVFQIYGLDKEIP